MNTRKLLNLSSLSIAVLMIGGAAASQFSMPSRIMLGPSLNKDIPAATSGPSLPAGVSSAATAVPVPPSQSSQSSTNIYPTLPTPPSVQQQRQELQQQQHQLATQPPQKTTAMERAGQLVRSVIRKIDPGSPTVSTPRDGALTNATSATATSATSPNLASSLQERNVKDGAAREVEQLQRGIRSEQKMNIGTVQ